MCQKVSIYVKKASSYVEKCAYMCQVFAHVMRCLHVSGSVYMCQKVPVCVTNNLHVPEKVPTCVKKASASVKSVYMYQEVSTCMYSP